MKALLDMLTKRFSIASPATPSEIAEAEKYLNFSFPPDYSAFLSLTNGLEGETGQEYLVLWSAQELIELNTAYQVSAFVAGILLFGSDGAEDAYGFDTSTVPASIVRLPFIGMGYIPNEKLADSFEAFLLAKLPVH